MSYFFIALAALAAFIFANKYYNQKRAIRSLLESLLTRTSILTHSKKFRGINENWIHLLEELNSLLADINRLEKQSSDRLRQIETTLGSIQEGVLIIDRDNYILLVNGALTNHFEVLSDSVGKRVESALHSSKFLEFIREVKRDGVAAGREIVFSEQKQEIWMEISASRLEVAEEVAAPWYLFVLHDITRLKALEDMRKHFVANASHELKTPVSIIKGYTETLVGDHGKMEQEDQLRFLNVIHRHAERLTMLINDLLSLSRLERESLSLHWSNADIFSLVRDFSHEYDQSLKDHGRELLIDLPEEGTAMVRVDVLKINQVLDNLIENARKYTPAEGKIRLGGSLVDKAVDIWVEDEGPGVPKMDVAKIFERFYRVDKGRSRDTGGTGLGLSIVKHIIDLHNGRVWAENLEGRGFRVTFRLPVVEKTAPAEVL